MERNEFAQDLQIDPEQLDVCCAEQGELFFKWAEKAVIAREELDHAKLALEVLSADLSGKIRYDPSAYGLAKVTEGGIQDVLKLQPEYKDAIERTIEAKREHDLISAAVTAMEQKKRMLESLVTLHGQQYFAGPSTPRSLVSAWKERKETREEDVIKKVKLRRRKVTE